MDVDVCTGRVTFHHTKIQIIYVCFAKMPGLTVQPILQNWFQKFPLWNGTLFYSVKRAQKLILWIWITDIVYTLHLGIILRQGLEYWSMPIWCHT